MVLVLFFVYQQLENHLLQPFVYGRSVKLSPLAILISVLIGAEVAGDLGALAAIPVAGTIQMLLVDWSRCAAASPQTAKRWQLQRSAANTRSATQVDSPSAIPADADAGADAGSG